MVDLQRPYDHQGWWAAVMYGQAGFYAIFRGIPPFVVGAIAFDLQLPSIGNLAAFLVAVVLAVGLSFGWRYLLQMSAFWIIDVRGPNQLGMLTAHFLCGAFIPIVFFPGWLRALSGVAVRLHGPGTDRDLARTAHRCRPGPGARIQVLWISALVGLGRVGLAGRCTGWWSRVASAMADLRVWRRLVGARIRADWQYRTSFSLFLLSQTLVACLDLAVVAAIFSQGRARSRGGQVWRWPSSSA